MDTIDILKHNFNNVFKDYLSPHVADVNISQYDKYFAYANIQALFDGSHPVLKSGIPRPPPHDLKTGWVISGINGLLLDIKANQKNIKDSSYLSSDIISQFKLKKDVRDKGFMCILQNKYKHKTKEESLLYDNKVTHLLYVSTENIDKKELEKIVPYLSNIKNSESQFVSEQRSNYSRNVKDVGKEGLTKNLLETISKINSPKLSTSLYNYIMAQKMGVMYTPKFSKEELLAEAYNVNKDNPKEITSFFQKSTYYADVTAKRSCSKDRNYEQGLTRESEYLTKDLKHIKQNELKKTSVHRR